MTHSHRTLRLLTIAGLGTLTAVAAAAQASSSYYYLGVGAGQTRVNIDESRVAAQLFTEGVTRNEISNDERSTGYKVFGGYQFNRNVALEAGWFSLGNFGFNTTTTPAGTLSGKFHVEGLNLDVVGLLPVSENFSLLARVGAQIARTRDDFNGTGAVVVTNPSPSRRSTNLKAGVGMQYAVNSAFIVRVEGEQYRVNDALGQRGNINMVSLSVLIPFGRAPSTVARAPSAAPMPMMAAMPAQPVAAAPMPAPMAAPMAAPAPAPVVVVVQQQAPMAAAPAPRKRVTFSAESLFGFDQSAVRPEGMKALDGFAGDLAGTQFDSISVEGHTDRLGSTAYNQRLSQQRADAVRQYMIDKGIDGSRLTAVGFGPDKPVADNKTPDGRAKNRRVEFTRLAAQ